MQDFLGDLLRRIENSGANFSQQAYSTVGSEIMPLLHILFVLYVAWYGLQLVTGTTRLGVGEIIARIVRMMVILALIGSWGSFDAVVYQWINNTPEDVGRAILSASGTGVTEPTNGMSQIWQTANEAASTFAEQSGYFSILPSMIGVVIMIGAGAFIAVALAILILAKVMLWVLIGTAPIFIACMLFERTRAYGTGWVNQVLTYALIPLFIYVIAAFLIAAMNPELTKIDAASGARTLTLADVAGFLLLCAAGAFVMLYIQSIGQGIASGIGTSIGASAMRASSLVGLRLPIAAGSAGKSASRSIARTGKSFGKNRMRDSEVHDPAGTRSAMQNKITRNSSPT